MPENSLIKKNIYPGQAMPTSANERATVLVVDDTPANLSLLSNLLKEQYNITVANNGLKALALAAAAPPDLVLLDIMMPEMDGYETLNRIKSNEALNHIPVIMISALDDISSIVRCIEMGAEDYIPKPFDPVLLRARVDATMERKRLRDKEVVYRHQIEEQNLHLEERVEAALHARVEMGSMFISVVVLMSVYAFILEFFKSALFLSLPSANTLEFTFNCFLEGTSLLFIIWILRSSRLQLSEFGVNAHGLKKMVLESLLVSAVVIACLIEIKNYILHSGHNPFPNQTLINWDYLSMTYVTYIVVAPLQEFIARGVFQNSVARLLVSKRSAFWSILTTSVLFAALHLHTSIALGVAAFISSWLWGWMFARQRSLIGVGLSHFLIGNCAGLLGLWTIT
jgi:CheY-like chemotaxis protein